jgi:hypothetical protein
MVDFLIANEVEASIAGWTNVLPIRTVADECRSCIFLHLSELSEQKYQTNYQKLVHATSIGHARVIQGQEGRVRKN